MQQEKVLASAAAVVGDLIGSRRVPDRRSVHDALAATLDLVNDEYRPLQPFTVTAGDEFQGVFDTVGAAVSACLRVRVVLLPQVDTRFGIGRGEITVLDAERGTQDGPAWWHARDAIEWVAHAQAQPATRGVRTAYRGAPGRPVGEEEAVNAALLCRDHLLRSLDERSMRIVKGMLEDQPQAVLAEREGISASAVSQRVRRSGLGVILMADRLLRGVP